MSIKLIKLNNFKSYKERDQPTVKDLSKGANVFVGLNGHGKSNLFGALTFIFTDILRKEERPHIIHNLADSSKDDVSVEIEIDNSNRKLPVFKEQIIFKRYCDAFTFFTLSQKQMKYKIEKQFLFFVCANIQFDYDSVVLKRVWTSDDRDEYYINDKSITHNQLNNILECQGIQRSNPYNIIQQGKISKITNMSEEQIYELLQEITGVNQYIKRREESLKNFEEIQKDKEQAEGVLLQIQKKIEELQNEKHQFDNYSKLENEAKCLQWCLYDNKLGTVREKLTSQESNIGEIQQQLNQLKCEGNKIQQDKYYTEQQLQRNKQTLVIQSQQESQLEQEMHQLNTKINSLLSELNIQKEFINSNSQKNSPEDLRMELQQIEQQIQQMAPSIQFQENQISDLKNEYSQTESKYRILMSKNSKKFQSIHERNQFISSNITQLQQQIGAKNSDHQQLQDKISGIQNNKLALKVSIDSLKQQLSEAQGNQSGYELELNTVKLSLKKLREESVQKMFKYNQNTQLLEDLKIKVTDAEKSIESLLKDSILLTVRQIQAKAAEQNIQGVYGLLIDHLEIPNKLNLTIDQVLKKKLFSLIVENEQTAEKIIQINKEIQGANLEIYPLDWVEHMDVRQEQNQRSYPNSQDVLLLHDPANGIKAHSQDPIIQQKVQKLISHLLSKYILVKDYSLALHYAKQINLNCITAEGEIVYAGGFLTKVGGQNLLNNQDKITIYKNYMQSKQQIKELEEFFQSETKAKDNLNEQEFRHKRSLIQIQNQINDNSQRITLLQQNLNQLEQERRSLENQLNNLLGVQGKIKLMIQGYEKEIAEYKKSMESSNLNGLTKEEEAQLINYERKLQEIKQNLEKILREESKNDLEYKLMIQKKEFLEKQIQNLASDVNLKDKQQQLYTLKQNELEEAKQSLEKSELELKNSRQNKKQLKLDIKQLETRIDQINLLQQGNNENQEKLIQQQQDIMLKRKEYLQRKDEFVDKQGNIAIFQNQLINAYQQLSQEEIMQKLKNLNLNDRKYTAKDKILFERLDELNTKYKEYKQKLNELEENSVETKNVIEDLNKKSQETVEVIFEKFSKYFTDYFKKVVPDGEADLMITNKRKGQKVKTGIEIKVKFTVPQDQSQQLQKDNQYEVQQVQQKVDWQELSQGQRSVIAIVLIFALQKCDPAPFYIFDEIDAPLDADYRRRIAQIISEQSKKAQYLITTFKPEATFIDGAKFFKQMSQVEEIQAELARQVIQEADKQQLV